MVLDTSAIIAILLGEPSLRDFAKAIVEDQKRLVSVFSVLEADIIMDAKKGDPGRRELDLLLRRIQARIMPLNNEQLALAREAMRIYGKGAHRASLTIGNCCAYALSKFTGEHLLFTGENFSRTDIRAVILD